MLTAIDDNEITTYINAVHIAVRRFQFNVRNLSVGGEGGGAAGGRVVGWAGECVCVVGG